MFAPKVAKPQTTTTDISARRPSLKRSPMARPRLGPAPSEWVSGLQRAEAPRGASFEFSSIPLFPPAHAKLASGQADDPFEREADRVADQVMRMPGAAASISGAPQQISRACAACEEDAKTLRRERDGGRSAPAGEVPPVVHQELRAPGNPLEASARAFFEPRFGHDLGHVRIHTGAGAAASARSVNALAYTVGSDIVFADGQYAPTTTAGRRLLAHELTHTLQQTGGRAGSPLAASLASSISAAGGPTLARQDAADAGTDDNVRDAGLPGGVETPAPEGGGSTGPSVPDCTAVMGGRGIEYGPFDIAGAVFNHTYVNFKENKGDYWLIEGGPLPTDSKKSGAWAKKGSWESRGNRQTTNWWSPDDCARVKTLLFDTQTIYHGKGLPYDPWSGPNSNSFCEHLCFKSGARAEFHWGNDKAYDYWQSHPRPS